MDERDAVPSRLFARDPAVAVVVGSGVDLEVFRWEGYREHARADDYTRSVIFASRS